MFNQKHQRISSSINSFFPKNHKAQVGETMTWVVATIVIIVVLSFSILISMNLFGDKKFKVERETDLLATKSLTGFLLTEKKGEKIFDLIKSDEKINDFEGNLALDIFKNYYQKEGEYDYVWFGVDSESSIIAKNDYFGSKLWTKRAGDIGFSRVKCISEKIELNEEKYVELFLVGGKNEK